jgi:hypothetical protein
LSAAAPEEHRGREEVPLQFEPGIRADVERVANHGVAGAHHARQEHQPAGELAELAGQPVDELDVREDGLFDIVCLLLGSLIGGAKCRDYTVLRRGLKSEVFAFA